MLAAAQLCGRTGDRGLGLSAEFQGSVRQLVAEAIKKRQGAEIEVNTVVSLYCCPAPLIVEVASALAADDVVRRGTDAQGIEFAADEALKHRLDEVGPVVMSVLSDMLVSCGEPGVAALAEQWVRSTEERQDWIRLHARTLPQHFQLSFDRATRGEELR